MTRRVTIQGHPDGTTTHLCHALADAYAAGAAAAGHEVRRIEVARIDFPLLRTQVDFEGADIPPAIRDAQDAVRWADHLVIVFPLWLGTVPALLKGFFEQVFRPNFAFAYGKRGFPKRLLLGRSARLVVTMGMPTFLYRWYFLSHGIRALERNILEFTGIGPIRETLLGNVAGADDATCRQWLETLARHGRRAN